MSARVANRAFGLFCVLFLVIGVINAWACELCKKNQPKVLEDVTHGAGPQGNLDYLIVSVALVVVGITLVLSLKFLISPGEHHPGHVKNIVVDTHNP
ncbi:MAG TPA: hypothetical protein PKJ63_08990 [Cyclobacteriaceae bacterium]|nr:hypothetical protein [Cyclobacteriaceae bacterium]